MSNGVCVACSLNCLFCISSTNCIECFYGYSLLNNACVSYGVSYALVISANSILNCDVNCQTCAMSQSNIMYCTLTVGKFTISPNQQILACDQLCAKCHSFNTSLCISCNPAFALIQGSCIACQDTNCFNCTQKPAICLTCLTGFTIFQSTCTPCASNCLNCL